MRRTTQRSLLQLFIFGILLSLILYLNHSPSDNRTFEWTKVKYQTTSSKISGIHGVCPGLRDIDDSKPVLVVSRVAADGDAIWLDKLRDQYHLCVYTVDEPMRQDSNNLQVPANRGHEAMAYLTFLIDNYAYFPAAGAVFVHGSRWAWHNDAPDYDNAALLSTLNISAALEPWGYHNLRCDWSVSTCRSTSTPQRSYETTVRAAIEPWNARAVSDAALPHALAMLFSGSEYTSKRSLDNHLLGRNGAIRAQCCAQFALARESAWQHSRDEYVALRQWLLDTGVNSQSDPSLRDDRVVGRVFSYIWHILFIRHAHLRARDSSATNAVHLGRLNTISCPSAEVCYCRLYGRCDLKDCTDPGHCYRQYHLPPGLKLPVDWATTHS